MSAELYSLGDPATHFWLTRSVARVMGIKLSEAMANGALSAADYADLVKRCRTCPNVAQCHEWLGQRRCAVPDAPQHCLNCDRLARIARDLAVDRRA